MRSDSVRKLAHSAIIAGLYVLLTFLSYSVGMSNGLIQLRLSEALTILPVFSSAAIPGLSVGCFVANIITGCPLPDIIFGTAATFIGSIGTYMLRKKALLSPICPILSNTLIIPLILKFFYGFDYTFLLIALSVFIGEFVSCGIFGYIIYKLVDKTKIFHSF